MVTFPYLKIFTVFSSFPLIIGDDSLNKLTAVGINHSYVDGKEYIKNIVHGQKVSEKPGIVLLFTAPYRLCEGGCNKSDSDRFGMLFPLFVGQNGIDVYKTLYDKDYKKIHNKSKNAPFKRSTTTTPTTTTSTTTTTTTSTTTTTTTPAPTTTATCKVIQIIALPTTEAPPTSTCPIIQNGECIKNNKSLINASIPETTTNQPTEIDDSTVTEMGTTTTTSTTIVIEEKDKYTSSTQPYTKHNLLAALRAGINKFDDPSLRRNNVNHRQQLTHNIDSDYTYYDNYNQLYQLNIPHF